MVSTVELLDHIYSALANSTLQHNGTDAYPQVYACAGWRY